MKPGEERDFRQFVERAAPTLLPAAQELTGAPDAATALVIGTLADLARRWHRYDSDPTGEAVKLLHRRHTAGPKVTPPAGTAPPDPATDGDPASEHPTADELATAALEIAGQQRRAHRLRTGIGAGIGAVAVAAAVVVAVSVTGLPERVADADPAPDLADHSVVASFWDGSNYFQLDPATGDYRLWNGPTGAVSPDLRSVAAIRHRPGDRSAIAIVSTVDRETRFAVELAFATSYVSWSPDGAWVAAVAAEFGEQHFRELVMIDIATGEFEVVPLDLPADRAAAWGGLASPHFWLDADQIAVVTADSDQLLPGASGLLREQPRVDRVGIFHRTGELIEELPLDTSELDERDDHHDGLGWVPNGLLEDGRYLLSRTLEPGHFQLAAVDPEQLAGPYEPVDFELPEPEPVTTWSLGIVGWFGNTVLVQANLVHDFTHPDFEPVLDQLIERILYLAELGHDGITITEGIDLAEQFPLPADATVQRVSFADAAGLAAAAAHRAFPR